MTGAWVAYRNLNQQMRIANIDRQMDQYAQSALQDLSNLMGWGWGAVQMQGGQNQRWDFVMDDPGRVDDGLRDWVYWNRLDNAGRLAVTKQPYRGILYARREPNWAEDQYLFLSSGRPGVDEQATIDSRDRISVEGLEMEWQDYYSGNQSWFRHEPVTGQTNFRQERRGVVQVTLTLHYRYKSQLLGNNVTGLFADEYVRERTYNTAIYLQNWEMEANTFRTSVLGG